MFAVVRPALNATAHPRLPLSGSHLERVGRQPVVRLSRVAWHPATGRGGAARLRATAGASTPVGRAWHNTRDAAADGGGRGRGRAGEHKVNSSMIIVYPAGGWWEVQCTPAPPAAQLPPSLLFTAAHLGGALSSSICFLARAVGASRSSTARAASRAALGLWHRRDMLFNGWRAIAGKIAHLAESRKVRETAQAGDFIRAPSTR